jgi:catechol 2,3-dioxygenase
MSTAANPTLAPRLPDTLRLGPVHLDVSSLDGSIAFYEGALGLRLHRRTRVSWPWAPAARISSSFTSSRARGPAAVTPACTTSRCCSARVRSSLARCCLASTRTRIEGASDHGVSQAIYLRDPDDNGIELYADRRRDQWPPPRNADERVEMYTIALDLRALLAETEGEEPQAQASPRLRTGHVHLHVADVKRALAFYRDLLGFEVMVNLGSAAFVSAGGYHHHLGFNAWLGSDVTPRPPRTAGLRRWTVFLERPDQVDAARSRVRSAGMEV